MQVQKITGIILDQKPFQEFDRIISVFSVEQGMLKIIAKGVRKIKSRRGFHLDLFNQVMMEIETPSDGRRSAMYLREITSIQSFAAMKKKPLNLTCARILGAFLKRTLPENIVQKNIFLLIQKSFEALGKTAEPRKILLFSLLKILRWSGYLPPTMAKRNIRPVLEKIISELDPTFPLYARRALSFFHKTHALGK